jgi:CHAT domain-containing protein
MLKIRDRRKAVRQLSAKWSDEHRSLARSSKRVIVVGLLFWLFPSAVTCGAAKPAQGITVVKPSPQAGSETRQADVRELQQGQTIEREMTGGATHTYRIAMTQGQYLHVVVEQKAIDVVVRLYGPEGKKLIEVDSPNGTQGPEPVYCLAESTGAYRLEVNVPDEKAAPGHYAIQVEELREATAKDRDRVAAEGMIAAAEQMRAQGTAELLRKAIEKYNEALPLLRKMEDRQGEATTLNNIGASYWLLGENQKALESHNQALRIRRELGNRLDESNSLYNIGVIYWQLGEYQKALDYYDQALPVWREGGFRQEQAYAFNAIGLAYDHQGKLQEAIRYFNEALALDHALGNRREEAIVRNNIGGSYQYLGELQKALDHYNQALLLAHTLGDRRSEATALNNAGVLYWQLGENQKALDYYNQALPLRRVTGDRFGEVSTLTNIGLIHWSSDESQKALEYYNQALSLAHTIEDRRGEANALNNIGASYMYLGEPQKALAYHRQALPLRRAIGDRRGEAVTLSQIGKSYISLGKPEEATGYLEQALSLHRAIGDKRHEQETLQNIARAARDANRLEEARAPMEQALAIIEGTRSQFLSPELRTSYLASNQSYYEFYIDLLMRLHQDQPASGYAAAALQASERARARSFLELLAEARIDVRQGIDPALKEKEKTLQARTSWIQNQLIQIHGRPKPDQSKIAAFADELKKTEDDREQLEAEIRQKHPRYAQLHYPTPLSLKAIQQLLDDRTALLEYSQGKAASFLFAVSKNDFLVACLPADSSLMNRVKKVREAIADKPNRQTLSNYLLNARSLYQELIQPAARILAGKKSLIIVADGILNYLPFEALLESDSRRSAQLDLSRLPYLVRDYAISYAPSATVLASLGKVHEERQAPGKTFLAYADPLYGNEAPAAMNAVRSAIGSAFGESEPWKLQPLPESRTEVEEIGKLYPPQQVSIFLREQASEENVKTEDRLSQYRYLHFAVHGLLNENKPQYSGLVLSLPRGEEATAAGSVKQPARAAEVDRTSGATEVAPQSPHTEDGLLQVYEIFNLKLNADLVVLSACETGLGKEVRGEGLIGLTRAFMYAGTPSVIVSLWKVQDKSTSELMRRFYHHLAGRNANKAEALRQAQIEMIRKVEFAHPYYWAGFVLTGQP